MSEMEFGFGSDGDEVVVFMECNLIRFCEEGGVGVDYGEIGCLEGAEVDVRRGGFAGCGY